MMRYLALLLVKEIWINVLIKNDKNDKIEYWRKRAKSSKISAYKVRDLWDKEHTRRQDSDSLLKVIMEEYSDTLGPSLVKAIDILIKDHSAYI